MRFRIGLAVLLGLSCLPFVVLQAAPQASFNATITGTVTDAEGARIPRAAVRMRDASGKVVVETLTDAQGSFRLRSGAGTLEVELTGFARWSRVVRAGEAVEVKLEVAPVRERVVVTATRTEVPTSQVGASVTVIAREEIEQREALRVPELLRSVPGLHIAQTGALGGVVSLFARGGESDHNRVFIDGVPVNEPGGAFNFANLTTLNLEAVEIVRGPQSALFGSDSIGSTVQVFTRRGQAENERPHFGFVLEGGNHHTFNGGASVTGEVRRFDYSASVNRFLTDNEGVNSAFRNTAVSGNFGVALRPRITLRAILNGNSGTASTPGQVLYQRPDSDAHIRRGDGLAAFSLEVRAREDWTQRFRYSYSRTRFRSLNVFEDPPPFSDFAFDDTNDTRRHRAGYQSDWNFRPAHTFTAAFEYEREKGRLVSIFPSFPAFSPPPVIVHRTNVGGVIQQQSLFGRLSVTAGVRIEGSSSFGVEATPRISLAHFLRRGTNDSAWGATKLKFNFGTGIKEPTFLENFSLSFGFMGNPNLREERVRSFDFGVEQRWFADRAKLEVNWFDNRFRDLIAFVNTTFINIGEAKAKGAEVTMEVAPVRNLRGIGSYTYLDSQVTDSPSPASPIVGVGRPLLRRPRHAGSIRLLWDWRRFNVASTALFVGARVDSDFFFPPLNLTRNDGHTRWDVSGSYRSPHKLTYFVAFENLANERYEEVLGYPALGRGVRAGVRAEF